MLPKVSVWLVCSVKSTRLFNTPFTKVSRLYFDDDDKFIDLVIFKRLINSSLELLEKILPIKFAKLRFNCVIVCNE